MEKQRRFVEKHIQTRPRLVLRATLPDSFLSVPSGLHPVLCRLTSMLRRVRTKVASGGTVGRTACVSSSVTRPPVSDAVLVSASSLPVFTRTAAKGEAC